MEAQFEDFEPFPDGESYTSQNVQNMSCCEEAPVPKKRRLAGVNRGGNFSIEEDKNIVSAWLNTSIDSVQGTDQKAKTFWQRIGATYNANKGPNHIERTDRSLSSRWGAIQLAVNKFCGFLSQIEDSRPSGTTEIDKVKDSYLLIGSLEFITLNMLEVCMYSLYLPLSFVFFLQIQMAKEMYHEMTNTHFVFDHCWNLLRHQPKWNLHMGQSSSKRKQPGGSSNKVHDTINLDADNISCSFSVDIERPIGRNAEKERRKKGKVDHKDLTEIVEQLTINKKQEHVERMALAEVERVRAEKEWQDHLAIENERLRVEKLRAEAEIQRAEAEKHRACAEMEKVEQQKKEKENNSTTNKVKKS
ncbi:glutathione S-transferase T3-like isoform X1 [Tripterygium wilfordii]|uniref:glutathione S-transferase T3-like isoform X1 n=1 Tax=Tripterygium wilfordii TaxID=458696 RepID=UPI0018F84CB7|nr:glutathione S-transferase T3-like isoform X1 [Tripterygium wilfordii]